MKFLKYLSSVVFLSIVMVQISTAEHGGFRLPDPYSEDIAMVIPVAVAVSDTIPIKDRDGSWIDDDYYNPFDITPSIVTQEVEYDPASGNYIILEKIGDEYYRTPSYMTFAEYMEWNKKKQERDYFSELAGLNTGKDKGDKLIVDPMDRIDIGSSLIDRLFGGTEVNIQPQGNVDLSFGFDYQNSNDETITQAQRRRIGFDFDMAIRMNVDGSIGEKLNLGFNYDTQSTFDFDRKIKLEYDSAAFSDDDIIKKIEAGNVSMPLRSTLIQGAQSLFGLKTELQFGHLKVTALASQQKSKQNNLRIENGASIQEFEVRPAEYDENRHFFLSHYHRDSYEDALDNLPFINSSFRISNIEVWISTEGQSNGGGSRNNDFTQIAAIADLAEPIDTLFSNPNPLPGLGPKSDPELIGFRDLNQRILPDNRVNGIYDKILADDLVKQQDLTASVLRNDYGMSVTRDFEKFQARKLSSSEFTYHEQLGMISLNIRLRPDQKLGVAYDYFYTAICDSVFHVGELANEGSESTSYGDLNDPNPPQDTTVEAPKLFFVKLLKSSNPSTLSPMWDLMMKNVYSLRTNQLNREDFEFDIFYDDPTDGAPKKFLPENGYRDRTLLEMFGLDRLNEYNDPQQDGIFDFVEGVTVNPRNGTIIFPVLEPFGNSLKEVFTDPDTGLNQDLFDQYAYQEMYDTSATIAKYNSGAQNRFIMKGKVKSAVSGEISLGPFVPEGSVRVSAGGVRLEEGRDYEIDYSLGRLRIINEAYLSQGTPINVSFEDNTVFSLQQKTMLGLRAEYEFSDNFNVGATYLRLFERPFTQKINVGNDPINNRVFGIDLEYSNEAPWLTSLVDKLPFFSTKEPSNINFALEGAVLKPGHSDAINLNNDDDSGVASIDDFEGAVSGFLIGSFNTNVWKLASTPITRPEALETESRLSSVNRAQLAWYSLDQSQTNQANAYTRLVQQKELFARDVNTGQGNLNTFDLSFYPSDRGPYNYDTPGGESFAGGMSSGVEVNEAGDGLALKNPEDRWGGVMRNFRNTDFEASNYQFIEFWMLNPYMDRLDGVQHDFDEEGVIEFHFGNVSEDILADNLQFFENALPVPGESIPVKPTAYGQAPLITPVTQGFDRQSGFLQDVGFDGIGDSLEGVKHKDYIDLLNGAFGSNTPSSVLNDPAGDNFVASNDNDIQSQDLLTRFKYSSNPEGNLPDNSTTSNGVGFVRGNRLPDTEDMNGNNSLDQGEGYWNYKLKIEPGGNGLDWKSNPYIKQELPVTNSSNPSAPQEMWYRVQIPLIADEDNKVGDINGFRSIQFMRMYMTGFKSAKTFRLAEMELVRNIWRTQPAICRQPGLDGGISPSPAVFSVDDVGIEENSADTPINYVTPPNIKQEELFNTFSALRQDEKSLEMSFSELGPDCEIAINKLANINLTFYEKLQMFTHIQGDSEQSFDDQVKNGEASVFIRLGDDSESNYYEYKVPLTVSTAPSGQMSTNDKSIIWPDENFIDLALEELTNLKIERNQAGHPFTQLYPVDPGARIHIIGNPSLAYVREIEVGLTNSSDIDGMKDIKGKVWINELRVAGFKEQAGYAATARLQMQMADLGELNFATTFTGEGWGGLDQKLEQRNQFAQLDYDASTSLELSKLLPAGGMGLTIPFFAQYSKSVKSPKFEAYSEDLTFDEAVAGGADRKDVEARSQETSTIKTLNFTNVKKAKSKDKKTSYPWDISNLSASYAYTQTKITDPIIEEDKITEHTGGIDYNYSRKGGHIKPFSFIKNKKLKLISEFNFNLLPNSLTFGTTLNRKKSTRTYRLPDTPIFTFDDQRFIWERRYGLNWDLTKALKFTYKANASAVVDELRQVGVKTNPADRDWVTESGEDVTTEVGDNPNFVREYRNRNLRDLGRSKNYNHNITATYTLPFKLIPGMDWINAKADYRAGYQWEGGALITIDELGTPLGNSISNNQARSGNVTFSFDKLYSKAPYFKAIDKGKAGRKRTGRSRTKSKSKDSLGAVGNDKKDKKKKKEDSGPSKIERILIRPLLALRDVKFSYKEDLSTFLPGFMPQSNLLGMSSGFSAPGWGFVGGLQPNIDTKDPNNYLLRNVANNYFNPSQNFSDEIVQTRRHNFDVKIGVEPFKDFDIDVNFRKDYQETHTEVFKNKSDPGEDIQFIQNAGYDFGSYESTYSGLSTLFKDNGDLYKTFIALREQVSNRLPNEPNAGQFNEDFPNYAEGYGPDNSQVLIPAFLAAYTNKTIDQIDINESLNETIKSYNYIPKPNWTLKYDGLSKLSMFKDVLSNFSITHGYKSSIRVNRFSSQPEYDDELTDYEQDKKTNDNYYSRVEVPTISIDEQFAPVLGISLKTKTDIQLDFEYRKSRRLDLGIAAGNLTEVLGTEYIAGFAYTIKDFKGFGKKNKSKRKKKDQEGDDKSDPFTNNKSKNNKKRGRGGNVNSSRGRNITMNFDFSYSDDVTWIYRFREELGAQPQRGQVRIFINPYVDYEMNENLNLRFFFEYSKTKPYSRTSFDRTNMEGGITVQFKLN